MRIERKNPIRPPRSVREQDQRRKVAGWITAVMFLLLVVVIAEAMFSQMVGAS